MRKAQLQTSKRICREGMRGYFHKLVRLSESLTESLCNVKELARLYESLWMPIGYVYELAIESCDFERHQATPPQYESRSEKTGHNACASIVVPD
ncbi:hypothetical protein DPMN_170648 [Dreissena polymorpha]|uniref:Uncharacterized protein n=1 Tax=Dreissena polymorpha TaxID=45954 RepID=A0A9D4DXE3_DREPO|nr:hypothetical protein DPMN_170648 [Dreissena polymorpha]